MTYLIAAAGTGGHVYPGLAVGEALIDLGVEQGSIVFVGGSRLEATVYPQHGFRFVEVPLAGLQRSMTFKNLQIPSVVRKAKKQILAEIEQSDVKVVLGLGGYVTVPAALAARKASIPLLIAEQNAGAGLANRVASIWARERFTSFPETVGLEKGKWVGNPVRRQFRDFDKADLLPQSHEEFGLERGIPTLGVFGGSLGSLAINEAVGAMLAEWSGPPTQIVHLTGEAHLDAMASLESPTDVLWIRRAFTDRMDLFFAACDLVVARGGGGLAEITATGTPSILIPGEFGSSGHQKDNSEFLARARAARVIDESKLQTLQAEVGRLLFDPDALATMSSAASEIARPDAGVTIAREMIEVAS